MEFSEGLEILHLGGIGVAALLDEVGKGGVAQLVTGFGVGEDELGAGKDFCLCYPGGFHGAVEVGEGAPEVLLGSEAPGAGGGLGGVGFGFGCADAGGGTGEEGQGNADAGVEGVLAGFLEAAIEEVEVEVRDALGAGERGAGFLGGGFGFGDEYGRALGDFGGDALQSGQGEDVVQGTFHSGDMRGGTSDGGGEF